MITLREFEKHYFKNVLSFYNKRIKGEKSEDLQLSFMQDFITSLDLPTNIFYRLFDSSANQYLNRTTSPNIIILQFFFVGIYIGLDIAHSIPSEYNVFTNWLVFSVALVLGLSSIFSYIKKRRINRIKYLISSILYNEELQKVNSIEH